MASRQPVFPDLANQGHPTPKGLGRMMVRLNDYVLEVAHVENMDGEADGATFTGRGTYPRCPLCSRRVSRGRPAAGPDIDLVNWLLHSACAPSPTILQRFPLRGHPLQYLPFFL